MREKNVINDTSEVERNRLCRFIIISSVADILNIPYPFTLAQYVIKLPCYPFFHKKTRQKAGFLFKATLVLNDYIIPPIPPMPPIPPISPPAGPSSFLGRSAIMHSVVNIRLATEAAFWSAVRVTLVGSKIPI